MLALSREGDRETQRERKVEAAKVVGIRRTHIHTHTKREEKEAKSVNGE